MAAYILLWFTLVVENVTASLLIAIVVLVATVRAGMPYRAKPDADESISAEIAVSVSVAAALLATHGFGVAPFLAVLLAMGIRVTLYTLGELIPPRKNSK